MGCATPPRLAASAHIADHVKICEPAALANEASDVLVLDDREASVVLAALLDERPQPRVLDIDFAMTGIGALTLELALDTVRLDAFLPGGDRVVAVADLLLGLIGRTRLRLDDRLHPVPAGLLPRPAAAG